MTDWEQAYTQACDHVSETAGELAAQQQSDAHPVVIRALEHEMHNAMRERARAHERMVEAKQQSEAEAAYHSPLGQAIKQVFDQQQYDYAQMEDWPEFIRIVTATLEKHGKKIVDNEPF